MSGENAPKSPGEVAQATRRENFLGWIKAIGPGVITGAADDDPSGIGTYTVVGAQFGPAFLWTAWLTWPLMMAVQMACARIGMSTGEGLACALERKIPRKLMIIIGLALFLANSLNVGADLAAMADGAELLTGFTSHVWVLLFAGAISWATIRLRYRQIAGVLKWLALSLFAYVATAFFAKPDWAEVMHATFRPTWPAGPEAWGALVAILGTTISPYLFFWQASQEVEEEKASLYDPAMERVGLTPEKLWMRRWDVGAGTLFSNLVMYFIILASWLILNRRGVTDIETTRQAAEALVPVAGRFAEWIFVLGLLGTGILAIPTLTGSTAYAFAEIFRWRQGLDADLKKARAFYNVIIVSTIFAVGLDFCDVNPIKALYWSAVINGLLAPFLILGILLVIRDRDIMREHVAPPHLFAFLTLTMLLMFAAGGALFFV